MKTICASLFAAYGPVDRVIIVTDRYSGQLRGSAFVDMASAGDADKAIIELNGAQLHGRTLNAMRRVAVQSARVAGKAGNAAEASVAGNHEATIGSEHLMSDSPKDREVPCGNGLASMRISRCCLHRAPRLRCGEFRSKNPCRRFRGCNRSRVFAPM